MIGDGGKAAKGWMIEEYLPTVPVAGRTTVDWLLA